METTIHRNRALATIGTDADDAVLAAAGDPRAFERLYQRHVPRIHSLARRMVGAEHADEVTQDAFVRAWDKLATFRGDAQFGTWLYRLATNVMLGYRASLAKQRGRYSNLEQAPEPATRAPRPELKLAFETAIAELPAGAREVFVLYDVEGYKHEEIAQMLGITAGTSKSQLHRARMLLRAHLG